MLLVLGSSVVFWTGSTSDDVDLHFNQWPMFICSQVDIFVSCLYMLGGESAIGEIASSLVGRGKKVP